MVFSSLLFTFYFLPAVLILYYISGEKCRNYVLLAASLVFYAYGEPKFVFVMAGSIALNYGIALRISRSRARSRGLLVLDVVLNIGILFACKYLNFTISVVNSLFRTEIGTVPIRLPIGISFFTFQALSYVIDVYRGRCEAQKNPLYAALYISFFPQLVAGPIIRYHDIEAQIRSRQSDITGFGEGVRRFFTGFGKKVILANNLALAAEKVFSMQYTTADPAVLWLGSICYSLQIYYDFSGYSDMAIGLGKMFGFSFAENFNYPYISKTVTEFWRRWHISLSQWFRDYVYIPLGGSRGSAAQTVRNMFAVWILTGLWHGANFTFIFWGLGYFALLVLEKYLFRPSERKSRAFRILWQVFTLLCVNFGWVIFNAPSLKAGLRFCLGMLGVYVHRFAWDVALQPLWREYGFYVLAGIVFSMPVLKALRSRLEKTKAAPILAAAEPVGYGLIFLWAVSFLVLGSHNPFIYFNF